MEEIARRLESIAERVRRNSYTNAAFLSIFRQLADTDDYQHLESDAQNHLLNVAAQVQQEGRIKPSHAQRLSEVAATIRNRYSLPNPPKSAPHLPSLSDLDDADNTARAIGGAVAKIVSLSAEANTPAGRTVLALAGKMAERVPELTEAIRYLQWELQVLRGQFEVANQQNGR